MKEAQRGYQANNVEVYKGRRRKGREGQANLSYKGCSEWFVEGLGREGQRRSTSGSGPERSQTDARWRAARPPEPGQPGPSSQQSGCARAQ
jgi:hypothetical protein